jgi:Icc-related predicted phosphoesterase
VLLFIAVSDVHSPRYLIEYISALSRHRDECVQAVALLWAGDMVDRGNVAALKPVIKASREICGPDIRIIAAYGNEEYFDRETEFASRYPEVLWLEDRYTIIEVGGERVAVYGTRGALEEPTAWQKRHIPAIRLIYARKTVKLKETVTQLKAQGYRVIVLMHYAPTKATLEGEDPSIWKYMYSSAMEKAILESKPDIVIHGHAHHSKKLEAKLGPVKVYNVALPARHDVTVIEI